MSLTGDSTILVPVDVSATDSPSRGIPNLLEPVNVVVLGYYPAPKQTAPAHLKADHEAEASARLDDIVAAFDSAGHDVEGVLVFTKEREDSIDRVADQHDCGAVLLPNELDGIIKRILVPLRGDVNLERIVALVGDLARASDATVTFFHASADGADPSQGEFMLRGAADRLSEDGVDRDRIDWHLAEDGDPTAAIVALADDDYDLVVLGETEPSLRERIIGTVLTPVIDRIEQPTLIVRDID
jgi:nucleotide-binding universal stress UspA family protein